MTNELLRAIELAEAGQWDEAHRIVQEYEGDATAAWIHAVLHKIEGDHGNSRYWYQRAGQLAHAEDQAMAELQEIRKKVLAP